MFRPSALVPASAPASVVAAGRCAAVRASAVALATDWSVASHASHPCQHRGRGVVAARASKAQRASYAAPSFDYKYKCTGRTKIEGFGDYITAELGPSRRNLDGFKQELGERFNASRIVLTNSGSSANLAASMTFAALDGVEEGASAGSVVTAGYTFPSTMASLITAGYDLRVADVDGRFCLSPEALEAAIAPDTVGICVTHFLGFPAQMARILEIAKANNLWVLQDACETMDLEIDGKQAHEYGDLTTWSFYHPHHLSSFGGGAVVVPDADADLHRVAESVTHWGRECTCHYDPSICVAPPGMHHNFYYVRVGHNLEMSELNACFGRFQLQDWDEMEATRKRHYQHLYDTLEGGDGYTVHPMEPGCGSPFVFPVTLDAATGLSAEDITNALGARGVEARSIMGGTITEQPAYRHVWSDGLANTIETDRLSFFVGCHQTLDDETVANVARITQQTLRETLG